MMWWPVDSCEKQHPSSKDLNRVCAAPPERVVAGKLIPSPRPKPRYEMLRRRVDGKKRMVVDYREANRHTVLRSPDLLFTAFIKGATFEARHDVMAAFARMPVDNTYSESQYSDDAVDKVRASSLKLMGWWSSEAMYYIFPNRVY